MGLIKSMSKEMIKEIGNKSREFYEFVLPPIDIEVNDSKLNISIDIPGFKKEEINVYTQDSKLFVEGRRDDTEPAAEYLHRGMAQRSFTRTWNLSDQTEVRSVTFEDGLLSVTLGKVVPEHHQRKDYL